MRNLHLLDAYRLKTLEVASFYGGYGDDACGVFVVPSKTDRAPLMIIASGALPGVDWEHVSVSRKNRTPNWTEMCQVKDLFFGPDETAMQLHVPAADHVNDHPYCLHLWRPTNQEIPRPPSYTVGGCSRAEADRRFKADTEKAR